MYGSGVRDMAIMFQKRVEASIRGRGGVGEDENDGSADELAPLSAEVGEESAVSAFRLIGSPNWLGFA